MNTILPKNKDDLTQKLRRHYPKIKTTLLSSADAMLSSADALLNSADALLNSADALLSSADDLLSR